MSQIEIKNLTKKFIQGSNEIYAVNNVSMQIEKGEMVAITGQSGSGKTTLLNLIGGIETPTSGSVFFDGINICELNNGELSKLRRTKIGYVFQDFNLIPILTVEENIQMPWLLNSQKVDKERLREIEYFLGLEERAHHLPSELSGGQRQRAAIARALINRPDIILADEPTGNLDRQMADEIMEYFIRLNKENITVILVTHEERYAEMCSRKIVISDGRIIKD